MTSTQRLSADSLYNRTDPELLDFETTEELEDIDRIIGQDRAVEAVDFGIGIRRPGFNIYALGSQGTGRHELIEGFLNQQSADEPVPSDWCYVYNFEDNRKPVAMELPAGQGAAFAQDMDNLVEELESAIPAAFETDEYRVRRQSIESSMREQQETAFEDLREEARDKGLNLLRTPSGLVFAPLDKESGEAMEQEAFQQLPDEEKEEIRGQIEDMQKKLQEILQQVPDWEREVRQELRDLAQEVARFAVDPLFEELIEKYQDQEEIQDYLAEVREDVLQNLNLFVSGSERAGNQQQQQADPRRLIAQQMLQQQDDFTRYKVNLLVDRNDVEGAPVIYEDNPAYGNLVGRVEYTTRMGGMQTDFTLIKAGALHRANGGYLMLDVRKLLLQPFAWEGLKRALRAGEIRIETPGQMMSQVNVVTLEPEAIPLDVKVALVGDRLLYYLLSQNDPEFQELFKVAADFEDVMDRTAESQQLYARLIASLVREEELRPLDRPATARVIEESARRVADAHRLSMDVESITDLLQEADYYANKDEADVIQMAHVERAIEAQEYRAGRVPERSREAILEGTIHIDTDGTVVGQINGLAILAFGRTRFGKPNRITARVRMGKGEVVNIEREVALSGSIHSKGVLILSSFLSSRYATDYPLSLQGNLVFEQSYGGVEGDSASSTELYALLSALANVPIKQSLAVTGSVDQFGNVQAIGGVNEKIEGFFAICKERGLTGEQGVLIPQSNVRNLMVRKEVVEAVEAGDFHIYPVENVDQGIELLTGLPAGEPDDEGVYPEETINRLVQDRLHQFAERWLELHQNNTGPYETSDE